MILPEAPLDPAIPAWMAETVELTQREFDALSDYSITLPTGTRVGKRWRRNVNAYVQPEVQMIDPFAVNPMDRSAPHRTPRFILAPHLPALWVMGEYVDHEKPGLVGIRWARIVVTDAPARAA